MPRMWRGFKFNFKVGDEALLNLSNEVEPSEDKEEIYLFASPSVGDESKDSSLPRPATAGLGI